MYKVKVVDNISATVLKKDMTFNVPCLTEKDAKEWVDFDIRLWKTAYKNEGKVFRYRRNGTKTRGWVEGIKEYWIKYEIMKGEE